MTDKATKAFPLGKARTRCRCGVFNNLSDLICSKARFGVLSKVGLKEVVHFKCSDFGIFALIVADSCFSMGILRSDSAIVFTDI